MQFSAPSKVIKFVTYCQGSEIEVTDWTRSSNVGCKKRIQNLGRETSCWKTERVTSDRRKIRMGYGEKEAEPQKIVMKSAVQKTVRTTLILEKFLYDTVTCMGDYRLSWDW
jgi:hypothetical protein